MRTRTFVGLILTGLWIALIAWLIASRWNEVNATELGEIGNLLAGATAAPALLWLVLGYYQQAEELRLSSRTLRLQAKELRHQVEETKALVQHTEQQALASQELTELQRQEYERGRLQRRHEAQPSLRCTGGGTSGSETRFEFVNVGGRAHNLRIEANQTCDVLFSPSIFLDSQGHGLISVRSSIGYPISFTIRYEDVFGETNALELKGHQAGTFTEIPRRML